MLRDCEMAGSYRCIIFRHLILNMFFFRCVVCAKHIDNHECFWKETHSISIGIHKISVLGSKRYISYSDTWHSLLPHWWNCHSDVRLWVYCDVINILSVLESTGILFTMAIVRHTTQYSDVSILKSKYFMYMHFYRART